MVAARYRNTSLEAGEEEQEAGGTSSETAKDAREYGTRSAYSMIQV